MSGDHIFVDESKRNGLLLAAVAVNAGRLSAARITLRGLLLPGQRRIHFKDERLSRKRQIIRAFAQTGATATIYVAPGPELKARASCLAQLVRDAAAVGAHRIVIERDDSLIVHDRRALFDTVKATGHESSLRYDHLRAHEEPLLWLPDAIAWCWDHGGDWRSRITSMLTRVVRL